MPGGLRNSFVIIEQKGAKIKGLAVHLCKENTKGEKMDFIKGYIPWKATEQRSKSGKRQEKHKDSVKSNLNPGLQLLQKIEFLVSDLALISWNFLKLQ